MANFEVAKKWSPVRILELHELARGGLNGNMNEQAKALAERTELLKDEKADKIYVDQRIIDAKEYDETFDTEVELKAFTPTTVGFLAKAWDTHKVYRYVGGAEKWKDLGLSEKDLAILEAQKLNNETLRIVDNKGISTLVESDNIAFAVSDEKGNTPFHVDVDGSTNAEHLISKNIQTDKLETPKIEVNEVVTNELKTETLNITNVDNDDWSIAFTDARGNVAFGIRQDGSIFPEPKTPEPTVLSRNIRLQMTDWIHGFLYGQSLANGVGTGSVVSSTQPYNNIRMKGGVYVRPQDTANYDATDIAPLVEARWIEGSSQIETPTSGFLNKLAANFESINKNYIFFGNAGGQSGARIQLISKGTSYYNSQIQLIKDAMRLAQERGLSYSVHFICWMQGEANQSSTTIKEYYDLLNIWKDDINTDIRAITGQDFDPIMLTYQVASHRWSERTQINIARAQWLASRDRDDIIMSHPMYTISYAPDYLHLSAGGSEQVGRWFGNAAFHVYQEQAKGNLGKFKPVQPEQVLWQGKIIDITFNVNVGSLTLDTTLVNQTHNYGFDVWNANDVLIEDAIQSVTVLSDNRIRIVLKSDYQNHKLSYGRGRDSDPFQSGPQTGARGNLRDQAGDTENYVLPNSTTARYLHNWCIFFEYSQQFGFYEGMN